MDIPLKRKYTTATRSRYKGGHNDGQKKRTGYLKGKFRSGGHIQYTMVLDTRGKRHFVPSEEVA